MRIANKMADWLLRNKVIPECEHELYSFASYCLIFTYVPIMCFLLVCYALNFGFYATVLVFATLAMRRYTGGYHAAKPIVCLIVTTSAFSMGLIVALNIGNGVLIGTGVMLVAGVIWLFSPMDSKNYRLNARKKNKYRIRARITLIIEVITYVVLSLSHCDRCALCFGMAIIITGLLLLVSLRERN